MLDIERVPTSPPIISWNFWSWGFSLLVSDPHDVRTMSHPQAQGGSGAGQEGGWWATTGRLWILAGLATAATGGVLAYVLSSAKVRVKKDRHLRSDDFAPPARTLASSPS